VDVSMSELEGMQQLQQTVERLGNKVASVNSDVESQKYVQLRNTADEHETELREIDAKICGCTEQIRRVVRCPDGQRMLELAKELIEDAPWLMKTIAQWTPQQVTALRDQVGVLRLDGRDPVRFVGNFPYPPEDALISLCASLAGSRASAVSNSIKRAVGAVPVLGSQLKQQTDAAEVALGNLTLFGYFPLATADWATVLQALVRARDLAVFQQDVWNVYHLQENWPNLTFDNSSEQLQNLFECLEKACEMKHLAWKMDVSNKIALAVECRSLDAKRSLLKIRIQAIAEELVNATVVAQLSRSFSVEAQSALIRFAQIAGKAKFGKSQQPSKMTQRQRRRRQEYLDAFDKCCRFIPCWILTTSQITDYLPAECLFDIVITDESSQSDVTVLPGMLRGEQWLVVGDGKQVSPTENFVSEELMESFHASLPVTPLGNCLLPGQSFFDLCGQAFPTGRVRVVFY
jgi:hypothetical protein